MTTLWYIAVAPTVFKLDQFGLELGQVDHKLSQLNPLLCLGTDLVPSLSNLAKSVGRWLNQVGTYLAKLVLKNNFVEVIYGQKKLPNFEQLKDNFNEEIT